MTIGKHLATFNLFRETDGLYITIADARVAQGTEARRAETGTGSVRP